MAQAQNLDKRHWESYQDTGVEKSLTITLSGTPGTVTTVSVPTDQKGFRIYSASDNVRFGVNQTVEAIATCSSVTIASSAFKKGGVALSGQWETRLLPAQTQQLSAITERYISLSSLVASTALTLELF